MRYLSLGEVLLIHRRILGSFGGTWGGRDLGALESAVAQPRASFGGEDLYPTVGDKAATLCFGIVQNHAFVDGNKRVGHAAMEVFLLLNGYEIEASVEEQERTILGLAAGEVDRAGFAGWVSKHAVPVEKNSIMDSPLIETREGKVS